MQMIGLTCKITDEVILLLVICYYAAKHKMQWELAVFEGWH